jgi:hypothetical protein
VQSNDSGEPPIPPKRASGVGIGPIARGAARAAVVLAIVIAQAGCKPPPPKGPATSLQMHPRAADRLARLLRQQLADSDPVAQQRLIQCESTRLAEALVRDLGDPAGLDEFLRRSQGVRDSIYRTQEARERYRHIDAQLGGRTYESVGPFCDSVNAIADREDPIVAITSLGDSTKRRPD